MAEKNVDELENLFLENANFVHMGGTWGTKQELEVIKSRKNRRERKKPFFRI